MTTGELPATVDNQLSDLYEIIERLAQGDYDLGSLLDSLEGRMLAAIRQLIYTLEDSEERNRELEALYLVMLDITRQPDMERLLTRIVEHAVTLLDCDLGGVMLYDPSQDVLVGAIVVGDSPRPQGWIIERGQGVAGHILDSREPLIVNDYRTWPDRLATPEGSEEMYASMGVPILLGDRLLGVIAVGSRSDPSRQFTQEDVNLGTRFATQAAIVMDKAQIMAEVAIQQEELEHSAQELDALARGLHDISNQPDLNTLLTSIGQNAITLCGSAAGAVYLYRPDRDVLELSVLVGTSALPIGAELKRGEGLSGKVWQTLKPQIVNDYDRWEGRARTFDDTSTAFSVVAVPIMRGDVLLGVLNAAHLDDERYFDELDVELLQRFADQAAVAIEQAQIVDDLEMRNRELDAFSHTAAHDLRAPLGTLTGYLYLLEETIDFEADSEAAMMIENMKMASDQMLQTIDSLLLLAHLREIEGTVEPVDMDLVIKAAVQRFQLDLTEYGIAVEIVEPLPKIMGYGPLLEEVLANLINNAIKYRDPTKDVPYLRISGHREGKLVRYDVSDNGRGINEEHQARLFEMFSRFDPGSTEGFGLGLSIVRRIIHKLNGEVGAKSKTGEGSTFWFTLPGVPD